MLLMGGITGIESFAIRALVLRMCDHEVNQVDMYPSNRRLVYNFRGEDASDTTLTEGTYDLLGKGLEKTAGIQDEGELGGQVAEGKFEFCLNDKKYEINVKRTLTQNGKAFQLTARLVD